MAIHEHLAEESAAEAMRAISGVKGGEAVAPDFRLLQFPLDRQRPREIRKDPIRGSLARAASKRAIDLVVSTILLIALAPLLFVIALVIRFDSAGPSLFRQQRLGLHGRPFRIFKFRTMHVLEDGEAVRQAEPNDRRVTRVGRILRATSLDELPQLINVARGEMSLVGPRPHAVIHDRQFGSLIENYGLRHSVKPGITGWAQVNGLRGSTPAIRMMRQRIEYDVWYARNASFFLDLRILLQTPREMFRQRNAY